MEIKYHSMEEKPVRSCEVLIITQWFDLHLFPYSRKHNAFGVRDSEVDDIESLKADEDCYIGWCYADEIRWQMVKEHEVQ